MSSPAPSRFGPDRGVLLVLAAVLFTSASDMLIVTPVLPAMAADLGVGVDAAGLWVTAYAVATAGFALVFGPISDRVGRKPVLIAGLVVLGLGSALCALATTYTGMLAARFAAGTGAGMLMTSTTAFAGDHFPSDLRAEAVGWVMSGFYLAVVLSVPLGSALAEAFGWSNMFLAYTALAAVVALGVAALPRPRSEQRTPQLSLTGALGGYRGLLGQRRALGVLLMSGSIGMAMTMYMVYASPWMEVRFGFDTTVRGAVYAIGGPAVILAGPISGRLSNRFGRVRMIVAGSSLMGMTQVAMYHSPAWGEALFAGVDLSGVAALGDRAWPLALPALVVFFVSMVSGTTRSSPFQTLTLEVVPSEQRGAISALRNTFNQGGAGVGAAIGGLVWTDDGTGYRTICLLAAATTALGITALAVMVGTTETGNGDEAADATPAG